MANALLRGLQILFLILEYLFLGLKRFVLFFVRSRKRRLTGDVVLVTGGGNDININALSRKKELSGLMVFVTGSGCKMNMNIPFMRKKLTGDVVLVTGGGSEIGRLVAFSFANLGAKVVIWDEYKKGSEETQDLIEKNGGQVWKYVCNVSDWNDVYTAASKVKEQVGQVSIVVNNSGAVIGKSFLDLPPKTRGKVFGITSIADIWTCRAFLPDMIKANKGRIVTIASLTGLITFHNLNKYLAFKKEELVFDEKLDLDLCYSGVRAVLICPHLISLQRFDDSRPALIPAMTPEFVAKEVVEATLTNQVHVNKTYYRYTINHPSILDCLSNCVFRRADKETKKFV